MKKLMLMVLMQFMITNCVKNQIVDDIGTATETKVSLTVEEAKTYFETEYESLGLTKAGSVQTSTGWISPGDFTPIWSRAVESIRGNTASVDVSIIPTYRFRAIRSEFVNGCARAYSVDVYQKLVVVKKRYEDDSEIHMGHYILTLIPDRDYATMHKWNVADRFINTGDKGGYSGLAVYFLKGIPMRLNKYVDGKNLGGISLFGETESTIIESKFSKIIRELGKIEFLRSGAIRTRSGEDGWEWDYGDTDDYIDLGDGIYQDNDGDYYIDWDGDGNIDSGYIMPDEPVTPDEPDPWEEEEGVEEEEEWWPPTDSEDEDDWIWEPPQIDNPIVPDELEQEYIKLGRQGVEKITGDLKSSNVRVMQATKAGLSGLSLGVNTYSIFTSVANFLEGAANDKLLSLFGNALGASGIVITTAQTFMVLIDEGELSTGEWLSIISSALGGAAIVCGSFAAPVSGVLGVTSAMLGIASFFVSENIAPGWYEINAPNGEVAYVCIGMLSA